MILQASRRGCHLQLDNIRPQDRQHGRRVLFDEHLGWYGNGDQLRAYDPGYSSLASAIALMLSWKKSAWVTEHNT